MHHYQDLIDIFNHCFKASYNTRLVKGDDEPIYLPADENRPYHAIFFAHGFFSSALHECAHWLIAGEARRKLVDFGYWYLPDGRTAEQQARFQSVEVKPQALEWILSQAAGHPFRVSLDNLNGETNDTEHFKRAVHQQVAHYCSQGLPTRAQRFRLALCRFYGTSPSLDINDFERPTLGCNAHISK
jgi:elongation factor P hydroxylase